MKMEVAFALARINIPVTSNVANIRSAIGRMVVVLDRRKASRREKLTGGVVDWEGIEWAERSFSWMPAVFKTYTNLDSRQVKGRKCTLGEL